MKPDFDTTDPLAKILMEVFLRRGKIAYELVAKFEDATRPVYAIERPGENARQIGSGVLVNVNGEIVLLSASHVFDPIGDKAVLVGCGDKLYQLVGERYSSLRGPSGTHQDDPIDASVFHIQGVVPEDIRSSALDGPAFLDVSPPLNESEFHILLGYRLKKSRRINGVPSSEVEAFVTLEYDVNNYRAIGVDRDKYVALVHEDLAFSLEKEWHVGPTPKGMSGGAIIRISGLPVDPSRKPASTLEPKLSAIFTERRLAKKAKQGAPGAMLGTRIGFHFGLIDKFLNLL